ncbi:MAG: hypothetical protein AAF614_44015, partial [Chloroflexota bacterium]
MIDITIIQEAFSGIFAQAITFLPKLVSAIIILLVGWFLSKFISTLIKKLAERIGLESILDRIGISGSSVPTYSGTSDPISARCRSGAPP